MKARQLMRAHSLSFSVVLKAPIARPFCSSSQKSNPNIFSVKKITQKNFNSALDDLRRQVREADFVSVDLEMTGVTTAPWRESSVFDRLDILYLKIKDSVENFAVVQFGVCPFRWDASKASFVAHPYTFYIFPRKELQYDAPVYEFLCQTTSMEFLAKYRFDFNACIREGISYLSKAQEAMSLSRLNSSNQDESSNEGWRLKEGGDAELVSIADILFTERMKERISEWRNSLLLTTKGVQPEENSCDLNTKFQTIFFKMRPSVRLDGFTSHQHRLIQQVLRKHFKDLAFVRTVDDNSLKQKLLVYTDSDEDRRLLLNEVKRDLCKGAELKVNAAVGFRHVVDLLSSEKKLVVGHNCFLDLAHIYNKFIGPLPSTVEEFAALVRSEFPFIIDTKYLLKADNVIKNLMKRSSTSLSSAFLYLCPQLASITSSSLLPMQSSVKVEVQVDDISSTDWNSGAKHEAGYDAIMTGCIFAQVCSHLGFDFKSYSPSEGFMHNEKLQKYMNYVYISGQYGAIIDLRTGRQIPEPFDLYNRLRRRDTVVFQNMVLLWGFHSNFKPKDMKECLSKVFGSGSVTTVYYLDETAAFVQFSKEELVSDFLGLKETLEKANDVISVVHPIAKLLEGGKTRAAPYEAYKVICGSSTSRILFAEQAETVYRQQKMRKVEFRQTSESEEGCDEMQSSSRHQLPFEEVIDVACTAGSQ